MFFVDAYKENAVALKNLLILFEVVLGIKINLHKSRLYKVGEVESFEELADILGRGFENFPCTYLGLLLRARNLFVPVWEKVLEKVVVRLARWKTKCLSIAFP